MSLSRLLAFVTRQHIMKSTSVSVFFVWALSQGLRVEAQQTNVTCDVSFYWANNVKGQSPCLVAAYLQGQCFPNKQWNVTSLPPGTTYLAPSGNDATGCACVSPVYSLMSACAACQGASYISWAQWTANCPSGRINNGTYPFQVPSDTVIPQWALTSISADSTFDIDAAQGGTGTSTGLSGATVFLIVLLPILLVGLGGFGLWIMWKRKQRRARAGSNAGREPLLRHAGGSRNTFLSVDTTSDVHIHLTSGSHDGNMPRIYDQNYPRSSPVPSTPASGGHSSNPSPGVYSPQVQYAHYPDTPTYQPHQPYLAPPSAGATNTTFPGSYHTKTPSQSQPPLTGATTNTFASQMGQSQFTTTEVEVENDSGTFPRTPIEPQMPTLPMGDPRRLLPPSVRAAQDVPSTKGP
ncbi:hypothetical protein BDV93DRAFT_509550 [Ceratobasidium sp. AG-I]|nr:hypothetical protein BDV93DRAFT_509550 [Ceratobasidium sp. AG-I]